MARWLLDAELGWGLPHWILAIPGLLVLGRQDLSAVMRRVNAWRERISRR